MHFPRALTRLAARATLSRGERHSSFIVPYYRLPALRWRQLMTRGSDTPPSPIAMIRSGGSGVSTDVSVVVVRRDHVKSSSPARHSFGTLPKHHHPGEEFFYLLEGSAVLWQEGKADVEASAGDALKVPLEQVHTAITRDEPMRAVVFRVHRKGEPERIPAE